jgi:hypothetical protein
MVKVLVPEVKAESAECFTTEHPLGLPTARLITPIWSTQAAHPHYAACDDGGEDELGTLIKADLPLGADART